MVAVAQPHPLIQVAVSLFYWFKPLKELINNSLDSTFSQVWKNLITFKCHQVNTAFRFCWLINLPCGEYRHNVVHINQFILLPPREWCIDTFQSYHWLRGQSCTATLTRLNTIVTIYKLPAPAPKLLHHRRLVHSGASSVNNRYLWILNTVVT